MAISEPVSCQETCKYYTLTLAHRTENTWLTFTLACRIFRVAQRAAVVLWIFLRHVNWRSYCNIPIVDETASGNAGLSVVCVQRECKYKDKNLKCFVVLYLTTTRSHASGVFHDLLKPLPTFLYFRATPQIEPYLSKAASAKHISNSSIRF